MQITFWDTSLTTRLVFFFLLISLFVISLIGFIAYLHASDSLTGSVFDRLEAVATLKEDSLNHWINDQVQNVILISRLPEIRAKTDEVTRDNRNTISGRAAYSNLSEF